MHTAWTRRLKLLGALLILAATTGCAGDGQGGNQELGTARSAFEQGDYAGAYQQASRIAERGGQSKARAAYLAGLAARQQGKLNLAARWLRRASRQGEEAVVADARAELGIVYHQQGKYGRAARVLERASQDLLGNDRAQALLFAGIARQKLGDWDQARRQLRFARAAATNSGLKRKINRQLKVTGYTIQVGAFREAANARQAARNWRSKAQNLGLRDPRLVSGQGQGGGLTSVQLGRFDTVAAANRARQGLGADNAIVVPLAGQGTR